jgi:hypothetical protein
VSLLLEALLACPTCAANGSGDGGAFWWILGAMILLPFPTAAAVIWTVKRAETLEKEQAETRS